MKKHVAAQQNHHLPGADDGSDSDDEAKPAGPVQFTILKYDG
jgi:hypothetical protein